MSEQAGEGLRTYQMTKEEEAIAGTVWPCLKCGRFEDEVCNGFNGCPHGRERPSMLKQIAPELYAKMRGS